MPKSIALMHTCGYVEYKVVEVGRPFQGMITSDAASTHIPCHLGVFNNLPSGLGGFVSFGLPAEVEFFLVPGQVQAPFGLFYWLTPSKLYSQWRCFLCEKKTDRAQFVCAYWHAGRSLALSQGVRSLHHC